MEMKALPLFLCFSTFFVIALGSDDVDYRLGIMKISGTGSESINATDICFSYPSSYFTVATESPKTYSFEDLSDVDPCSSDGLDSSLRVNQSSVFLMKLIANCSLPKYFSYIKNNGSGIILIANRIQPIDGNYSAEVFVIISNRSAERLMDYSSQGNLQLTFLTEEEKNFNPNVIVLWGIAFFCVAVGSYTGPYREIPSSPSEQQILEGSGGSGSNKDQISLNVVVALIIVVFISSALLLLYFFYNYLVYVFMAVFCFASARATYDLWLQVLRHFKVDSLGPRIRGLGLLQILLMLVCAAVPIVWFVFRHRSFAWALQDYLGICFCIHLIQTLRLPNLKVCSILLCCLFVYDIFFVFITPFFTADGQSVMVEVATGGGSGEELPLLLKVPQLQKDILSVCAPLRYSLLGFGDIIVPGFLVCFAHSFDIYNGENSKRPYFVSTLIGYGVGLAAAFLVLTLSQTGQPALLYVVPSVLIPIYAVALCKKQLRLLWDNTE